MHDLASTILAVLACHVEDQAMALIQKDWIHCAQHIGRACLQQDG